MGGCSLSQSLVRADSKLLLLDENSHGLDTQHGLLSCTESVTCNAVASLCCKDVYDNDIQAGPAKTP